MIFQDRTEPMILTTVRLPQSMMTELSAVARSQGLNRNNAMVQLLRYALTRLKAYKKRKRAGKK